jgi:hypothetical protein
MLTYSDRPMAKETKVNSVVASAVSTVDNYGGVWVQAKNFLRDLQCENRGMHGDVCVKLNQRDCSKGKQNVPWTLSLPF